MKHYLPSPVAICNSLNYLKMHVLDHRVNYYNASIFYPLIISGFEIISSIINLKDSVRCNKMKDSFTIVEPNSHVLNYIYRDSGETSKDYHAGENLPKGWRRENYLILAALITVAVISVSMFIGMYCLKPSYSITDIDSNSDTKKEKSRNNDMEQFIIRRRIQSPRQEIRLNTISQSIEPLIYQINISLENNYLQTASFHGNVSIELLCKKTINHIVIRANELGLKNVKLIKIQELTSYQLDITIDTYDSSRGILIIQASEELKPSFRYILKIEYRGYIHDSPYGLFIVQHETPGTGTIKTFIGVNTEIPFAHTIFPCLGSSTHTSQFFLNICRPKFMTSVTSSSLTKSVHNESETCIWDTYSPTVKLPTRLLSFAISDYTPLQTTTNTGTPITIWNARDTHRGFYHLLEIIKKLITVLESYFDVPFPKDRVDVFCLPSTIPYITSKFGLIMIQESEAIFKERYSSELQKEKMTKIAAVHLAEQWIDYMIIFHTEDQWIKDSLIQYVQHIAVNLIEPKWRAHEEFYISILQPELDAFTFNPKQQDNYFQVSKHFTPSKKNKFSDEEDLLSQSNFFRNDHIETSVYSEFFKRRSNEKGVCLMRFLQHALTDPIFRKVLKKLLLQGGDKVLTADHLWNLMTSEVTDTVIPGYELLPHQVTLKAIVNEWIFNKNYPILKVIRKYGSQTDNDNSFRRLYRHLPISYTTGDEKYFNSTTPRFWLKNVKQTINGNFSEISNNTWLLVNPQQTGMYRVDYDEHNWQLLKSAFERNELPTIVRSQLLDDILYLGFRGYVNYEFALNFTQSLSIIQERQHVVWNTVLRHFDYIDNIMATLDDGALHPYRIKFNNYIKHLLTPIFETMDFHRKIPQRGNDYEKSKVNHGELLLYADVFNWACKVGYTECIAKIQEDFHKWQKIENQYADNFIDPNTLYATLCNMMRTAQPADFEYLLNKYKNTLNTDPNRYIYLKSMYCYHKIGAVINSILAPTLFGNSSLAHLSEVANTWQALAEHPISSVAPFDFVIRHWREIVDKYSGYVSILIDIIEGATVNLSLEDQLNLVHRLSEEVKDKIPQLKEIFSDIIKHTKARINWKYKELHILLTWIARTKLDN